ncbi:MAG: flagellar hook-basal body protein [Pseudomonadota bacterium]
MSGAFYVGAVGMQAQQRALDTIANNISNVNTPGFKRSDVRFAEVVLDRIVDGPSVPGMPVERGQLSGVQVVTAPMLSEQGELNQSGQALDIAIEGAGFLELMGSSGQTLLWRGGRLRVLEDGTLASAAGIALKAGITVPADVTAMVIARDGIVTATTGDGGEVIELGQIMLVRMGDDTAARRLDGGLYLMEDTVSLADGVPGEDGFGAIVQGAIERSTVSFNDEMVSLLLVQRAYAANAQIVQAADQLLGIANNLRR